MQEPILSTTWQILLLFLADMIAIEMLSRVRFMKKVFAFVPAVFWFYFLPMLYSAVGFIPRQHDLYQALKDWGLFFALILLIMPVRPRELLRLGIPALVLMVAGSFGIVIGAVALYPLFQPWLGVDAWQLIGPLSASWIGGSLNMVSVAASYNIPGSSYAPIIVVDTFIGYSWMAFLLFLAGRQGSIDRWVRPKGAQRYLPLENSIENRDNVGVQPSLSLALTWFAFWVLALASLGRLVSTFLPTFQGWLPASAWGVILVSVFALALGKWVLAFDHRLSALSSESGSLLLYLLISAIGAQADLSGVQNSGLLFLFGICWIFLHGLFVLGVMIFFRYPLVLAATASQANIGGVVSAPIVAEAYRKGLAPLGLVMAVLGNIYGFYFAVFLIFLLRYLY